MPQPLYGLSSDGSNRQIAVDGRGRVLLSPQQHLTRAQFPRRVLDWAADNLVLTILLVGINAQLGVIIWLLARAN